MKTAQLARLAVVGMAVLAPLMATNPASATDPTPTSGDPAVWGPPLAALCDSPDAARKAGYIVIIGTPGNDVLVGSKQRDAIYARGGNDRVKAGEGDDVICLGGGYDRAQGNEGNDAIFGGDQRDFLQGGAGRDYLDGGAQKDACVGGDDLDAAANCELTPQIP